MNYYYPEINSQSKAIWVLDALSSNDKKASVIRDGKFNDAPSVFWGLAGNNFSLIKQHQARNIPYIFTDMPYWGRWMGDNRSECYWRVIPNSLHCDWVKPYPNDRFDKLNITVKDWRTNGDHILVCPSSATMNRFYNQDNWLNETLVKIRKYTDRPIKIRHKPRNNKSSGPAVATIPFEEDIKNAWAVVTLASIAGVESACLGVPVFTAKESPCAVLGNTDLSNIEHPKLVDRTFWLNTLAYFQYTEDELKKIQLDDIILLKS